jgi:hypothetical protein
MELTSGIHGGTIAMIFSSNQTFARVAGRHFYL